MHFLILGQGLAGSWVSYFLERNNQSFTVVDPCYDQTASLVAAGIINPVTGRRIVKSWLIDELIPFSLRSYGLLGEQLGVDLINRTDIIEFFPSPFMRESFIKANEKGEFLALNEEHNLFNEFFNYEFGYGTIKQSMLINTRQLIEAWRDHLKIRKSFQEKSIDYHKLVVTKDSIEYEGLAATHLICCDGTSIAGNPFFSPLPWSFNKGEALIIETKEALPNHIYKKNLLLAPAATNNRYWVGSNYQRDYADASPTQEFREQTEMQLRSWLKIPFIIREHIAAVRPGTVERRPFVGIHPKYQNVSILNGLGTKGSSLAPYFANQLVDQLLNGGQIHPEADVRRFSSLLSRS